MGRLGPLAQLPTSSPLMLISINQVCLSVPIPPIDHNVSVSVHEGISTPLKAINKEIPKSVDFFYRETSTELQKQIDTKKRTKDTKARRQAQRDFLETATDEQKADFPQKLIDSLNAKPLEDVTVAELEELVEKRKQLEKTGKQKKSAKIKTAKLRRENNIKKVVKTAESVTTEPEQDGFGYVTNDRGLINKLKSFHIGSGKEKP